MREAVTANSQEIGPAGDREGLGEIERALRRFRANRVSLAAALFLAVLIVAAVGVPWFGLSSPTAIRLDQALIPPSPEHVLGTDGFGRDVRSRLLFGARTSLAVGFGTVLLASAIGIPIGLLAGYIGGRTDSALMRTMDALLAFPAILLALVISATLGPSTSNVTIALGVVFSPGLARLMRAEVLSAKGKDYVESAVAIGASAQRIVFRHIVPSTVSSVIVFCAFIFARAVVAEAAMSFLGLGTQPPNPSWGLDVSEGRRYIRDASWLVIAPSIAISLTVLAFNFLGDAFRDALDPKLSET